MAQTDPYLALKIARRQLVVLAQARRHDFVERVARHVRQFFSKHAAVLDEKQLRGLIEHGIERAAAHRIVTERDVCKLVDLMVIFGPRFESDPRHPWAARLLSAAAGQDPSKLVDSLYDAGLAELARQARGGGSAA